MAQAAFVMGHFRLQTPKLKRPRMENVIQEICNQQTGVSVEDFVCFQRSFELEMAKLKRTIDRQEREIAQMVLIKQQNNKLKKELLDERKPFQNSAKTFNELHRSSQHNKTKDVKNWLCSQLQKLPKDWQPQKVDLKEGDKEVKFKFGEQGTVDTSIVSSDTCKSTDEMHGILRVQKALKAKDEGNISDAAYHELKMITGVSLPPINQIKKERQRQNAVIGINELDKDVGIAGCVRSIREVSNYLSQDPTYAETFEAAGDEVLLRYAGDGRRTTKKLGSTMATFCVVGEKDRSPDKEYCISLFDGPENQVNMAKCMPQVFKEMDDISKEGLTINNKLYKIKWLLCSDWKYMAAILGINAPCSTIFCLWCHCSKALIRDFSIADWPITRTLDECDRLADPSTTDENRYGIKSRPLVKIEFTHIIADTLHLKLRIRGKLLNQVACWAIQQKKQKQMEDAMEKIGLRFLFTEQQDENSGKTVTKWTSFDCDDLEKVIKKLDLLSFLSDMSDKSRSSVDCLTKAQLLAPCKKYGLALTGTKDILKVRLQQHLKDNKIQFQVSSVQNLVKKCLDVSELTAVWKDFETLADALTSRPGEQKYLPPGIFKARALQWGKNFRKATFDEDVIPYIHVLIYHVPQFLENFGYISDFNCQTVEKKNHLQNKTFHQASQKSGKGSNYTVQVMERENRQMFARVNNVVRKKRAYTKKNV